MPSAFPRVDVRENDTYVPLGGVERSRLVTVSQVAAGERGRSGHLEEEGSKDTWFGYMGGENPRGCPGLGDGRLVRCGPKDDLLFISL